jgi:hypothetical protein
MSLGLVTHMPSSPRGWSTIMAYALSLSSRASNDLKVNPIAEKRHFELPGKNNT